MEQSKNGPASGSVEKTAETTLAKPAHSRPDLSSDYVAPGNSTEQIIAKIWQELLKIDKVGVYDNFFELGGHSLLAIQLIAWIQRDFNVELSIRQIFETPTVSNLATAIINKHIIFGLMIYMGRTHHSKGHSYIVSSGNLYRLDGNFISVQHRMQHFPDQDLFGQALHKYGKLFHSPWSSPVSSAKPDLKNSLA